MLVAEESAFPEGNIVHAGIGRPRLEGEHRSRDIDREDLPASFGGLDGEGPGAGAEIDHDVVGLDLEPIEQGIVLDMARPLVAVIGGDCCRILEIETNLPKFVIVP